MHQCMLVVNYLDLNVFVSNYFIVNFSILYMYLALKLSNSSQTINGFMMVMG